MTIVTLGVYYSLSIALVGCAILLALWQNTRERAVADSRHDDHLHGERESTPNTGVMSAAGSAPDLSAPALQPIAPLLLRVAKNYLDNPHDRERLLRSLTEALGPTATSSPAP